MPGLKAQPPARKRTESRGKSDSRRGAHEGIDKKMVAVAPVELFEPDPRLLLRKRLREEMEELHGLVKKAELLIGKNGKGGAPHRFGGRRLLEAETRRPDTTEGERTSCAKKRKMMPVAKIFEPMTPLSRHAKEGRRSLETEARQESTEEEPKVAFIKKRKTMLPVKVVEPRTPKHETVSLARSVSSLSAKAPTRVEKKEAANASMPISLPSPHQLEEGEIIEEEIDDILRRETGEIEEGECGGASPVSAEEFVATNNSPRSSSSLSRLANDESAGSSPAPFFLPKRDEEPEKPVEQRQTAAQSEISVVPAREKMRQLRREPARQKAWDELEAMERNALPSDWIRPMDMIKFGITAVEYLVTSDCIVPGVGGPVQQLFGLSWKGE